MEHPVSKALQCAGMGGAASRSAGQGSTDSAVRWVFVAHQQVGLLHRLRPVARASTALVLVRMDVGVHPEVHLGVAAAPTAPRLDQVRWFAGLTAPDVSWLGAEPDLEQDVPVPVARRRLFRPGPRDRSRPADGPRWCNE